MVFLKEIFEKSCFLKYPADDIQNHTEYAKSLSLTITTTHLYVCGYRVKNSNIFINKLADEKFRQSFCNNFSMHLVGIHCEYTHEVKPHFLELAVLKKGGLNTDELKTRLLMFETQLQRSPPQDSI